MANEPNPLLEGLPQMNSKGIREYANGMGIPNIPQVTQKGISNAMYVPANGVGLAETLVLKKKVEQKKREIASNIGMIVYGNGYKVSPVVAHELGHATIANDPEYTYHRMNQKYVSSPLLSIGGAVLGTLAGGAIGGQLTNGSLPGIVGGAMLGDFLGLSAPRLVNEYEASRRANEYLDASKGNDHQDREKERQVLKNAYKSYIYGAIASTAIAGGISAYVNYKPKASIF